MLHSTDSVSPLWIHSWADALCRGSRWHNDCGNCSTRNAARILFYSIPNATNAYNPHYAIPFNNYQTYAPVYDNRDYPFKHCSNYYPHNPNPRYNNNYYPCNPGNSWVPPAVAAGLGAAAIAGTAGLLYTHNHHELDRHAPPPPPPPQPQDFGFSNNLGYINSRDVSASANGQCAPSRDTMTPGNNMPGDDVIGQWVEDY